MTAAKDQLILRMAQDIARLRGISIEVVLVSYGVQLQLTPPG